MKVILLSLIIILMLPQSVDALGIGPARVELDFEPGLTEELFIAVFNDDSFEQVIDIYVEGDLAEYVTLQTTSVTIPADSSVQVDYTLTLPATAPGEGLLDTRIGAVQTVAPGEGNTVAKVAVESQLWVYAPFEGKKLDVTLEATDVTPGEDITLTLGIDNVGSESVEADPTITLSKEVDVATIDIDPFPLASGEEMTLVETYPSTGLEEGLYTATAEVAYDGTSAFAQDTFNVGGFVAKILEILSEPIAKGSIARFDVQVESLWNQPIEGAFVDADVFRESKIDSFTSQTVTLTAADQTTIPLFWDTSSFETGEYLIRFTLHYGEKTDSKDLTVQIVEGLGFTFYLLIILVIILIILLWIFWKRRKKKKKRPLVEKKAKKKGAKKTDANYEEWKRRAMENK